MKQKLGLCCALIHDPDLLILDEPTTGVDPLAAPVLGTDRRIRARRPGMSVLGDGLYGRGGGFDWLVAMDAGKVLDRGTPAAKRRTGPRRPRGGVHRLVPQRRRGHHELAIPPRSPVRRKWRSGAEGLTQRFGDFTAVDHVSFEIAAGEIFGFLGSNGCGKTTTMKMLTGLPPTEGEARTVRRDGRGGKPRVAARWAICRRPSRCMASPRWHRTRAARPDFSICLLGDIAGRIDTPGAALRSRTLS